MYNNSTYTPKVSIVTVVYNARDMILDTMRSVFQQDYPNVEYIVIDGASTDGTLDIISPYQSQIVFLSEADKGVYDAMNKGIDRASGEWILFMNAGDFFHTPTVISEMMAADIEYSHYAVVYGDAAFRLKNIAYISEASDHVDTNQYMPFSHQAAFTRTEIAKKYKFDLTFKIAADTAFFLQLTREDYKMKRIPIVVCSYNALEGLSADNEVDRSMEIVALQAKFNGIDPSSQHFERYIADAQRKQLIRRLLPKWLWIRLREKAARKKYKTVYSIDI